jgi:hypothetical protein
MAAVGRGGPDKTMTTPATQDNEQYSYFADQSLDAFERGMAAAMITRRNAALGNLFTAERASVYVTILYRMLLFKREHELEPLYEDIYQAVLPPLEALEGQPYPLDRFRGDMDQLADWQLVSSRIEKQRLRGYRDNRKRKFRFRLSDEAATLLHWLEERLQDDFEERGNDARDLLGEVRGALGELLRLLHGLRLKESGQEDVARRIIFQLGKSDDLCQAVTAGLVDLNGRLLAFLLRRYETAEVRAILAELDIYVQVFLKQAFALRREIVPLLHRLQKKSVREKIHFAFMVMEKEREKAPHLLRVRREASGAVILDRLKSFFAEQGGLDHLLQRINESSLQVWQKLRSHLQELERKNHRLEDLRRRIDEIATLDESTVPFEFFSGLLAWGQGCFDKNSWHSGEKAEPPQPVRRISKKEKIVRSYLKSKERSQGPVQSMDEARLALLEEWLRRRVLPPPANGLVGKGDYDDFSDFQNIMELVKSGILADGRRLAKIAMALQLESERLELVIADCRLNAPRITVHEKAESR